MYIVFPLEGIQLNQLSSDENNLEEEEEESETFSSSAEEDSFSDELLSALTDPEFSPEDKTGISV